MPPLVDDPVLAFSRHYCSYEGPLYCFVNVGGPFLLHRAAILNLGTPDDPLKTKNGGECCRKLYCNPWIYRVKRCAFPFQNLLTP